MSDKNISTPRLIVGLLIIAFGGLVLLRNQEIISFDVLNFDFSWQIILIIIGTILLTKSKKSTAGLVLLLIGGIGLIPDFWPVILIALGLFIIFKQSRFSLNKNKPISNSEYDVNSDLINDVAIFGGGKKYYQTDNFNGGNVTSIFGGSEIDLLDCKLAEGQSVIDMFALFGGSSFRIPNDWNVEIDTIAIFGGFSDKRRRDPNLAQREDRKLLIKGFILFGGGEIKS